MKASELQLGDWVQIVPDAPAMSNEYHRIDWIRTGEIGLDNRNIVTYPYIQSIPLTLEILEKNGFDFFERNGHPSVMGMGPFELVYDYTCCCDIEKAFFLNVYGPRDIRIDYVHQLQHVLKLCGISKEIVI